jgi:hypothetical protein
VPLRCRNLVLPFVTCAVVAAPATAVGAPKARYERPSPVAGKVATFDASPTACDRKPCSHLWRKAARRGALRHARPAAKGKVVRIRFRTAGVRYVRLTVINRVGQRSSTTKRIVEAGVQNPRPGAPAPASVSLQDVDGGLNWYGAFAHSLPTSASHFPIGVWFESVVEQGDIDKDKAAGLNTYVVLTGNSDLPLVERHGMKVLAQHGEWTDDAGAPGSGAIAAWELRDEIDMELGPDEGYNEQQRILSGLPADGRLRYNNYGKGVLFWQSDQEAARFINAPGLLASADAYWFTDNNICSQYEGGELLNGATRDLTPAECHRAANYGAVVKRMRELVDPRGSKPVWAFVELGHPFTEDDWPSIKPAEVEAAVWHSLIGGARGIIYFNHSFGGPDTTQHILREPSYSHIRSVVEATNRRIHALAAVLNSPTVASGWSEGGGTKAMVKWSGGHFYVFAGSAGSATTGTFSVPCVGDASATVLNEGRSIPVRGGSFDDRFGNGNAIHIYRIDGGSSCGLPVASPGATGGSLVTRVGRLPKRVSLRSGRLVVPVACAVTCTARSRLTTLRGGRRVSLAAARKHFKPGKHKLILRHTRRDRRLVAGGRAMRLRTVIVQSTGTVQRTQRLVAKRR